MPQPRFEATERNLVREVVEAVRRQDIDYISEVLRSPSLGLSDVSEQNKEWYFVVIEKNVSKLTDIREASSRRESVEDLLRDFLQGSVRQANAYAQRETILDGAASRINVALGQEDPKATFFALLQTQNLVDWMPNWVPRALDTAPGETDRAKAVALLLHEELSAAVLENGGPLTFDEISATIEALVYVAQLDEAIDEGSATEVNRILCTPAALWDLPKVSASPSHLLQSLSAARVDKEFRLGHRAMLSHGEVQSIVDKALADDLRSSSESSGVTRSAKLVSEDAAQALSRISSHECVSPATLSMERGEKVQKWPLQTASDNSDNMVSGPRDLREYLSLLERTLQTSSTSRFWKLLEALNNAGCFSPEKEPIRLYQEYTDLYIIQLRRALTAAESTSVGCGLTFSAVSWAIETGHLLAVRAKRMGQVLGALNTAIADGDSIEVYHNLMHPALAMNCPGNQTLNYHLQTTENFDGFDAVTEIHRERRSDYTDRLISLRKAKIRYSKCRRSNSSPEPAFEDGDLIARPSAYTADCSYVINCNWLFTSLPLFAEMPVDRKPSRGGGGGGGGTKEAELPFFYNTRDGRIVWCPAYSPTNTRPICLDPGLLNREEIVACVRDVNRRLRLASEHQDQSEVGQVAVPVQMDAVEKSQTLCTLESLIRAYLLRKQHQEWSAHLTRCVDIICDRRCLIRGVIKLQAAWRGVLQRRRYLDWLSHLSSFEVRDAGRKLFACIRRHRMRRMLRRVMRTVRRLSRSVRRVQALWRGHWLRKVFSVTIFLSLRSAASMERQFITSFGQQHLGASGGILNWATMQVAPPLNYLYCVQQMSLLTLNNDKISEVYEQERASLASVREVEESLRYARVCSEEVGRIDRMIGLFMRAKMQQDARRQKIKTKANGGRAQAGGGSTSSTTELYFQAYSGLLFLLYSQPDYLARLLEEIPGKQIWQSLEAPMSVLEAGRISLFGLLLERLILGIFHHGLLPGDEQRLLFLISRSLHLHIMRLADCQPDRAARAFDANEPCPFALRLAVSLAHTQQGATARGTRVGDIHQVVKPLSQMLAVSRTPPTTSAASNATSTAVVLGYESTQDTPVARARVAGLPTLKSLIAVISSLSHYPADGSAGSAGRRRRRRGDLAREMDRGDSRLEVMPKSLIDVTGNNVLDVATSEHGVIPTLISTAERFFYALFTDPGSSALPHSLCVVIRDFYLLLRREFPQQPSKDHMKYVGLNLLFRYLNSVVIAPDAFGLLLLSEDAKSIDDGDSRRLFVDPEHRSNSRLERSQRRRLTALSRLLLFVIANKGFSTRSPPDARYISPQLQQSQEFGRIINPLIRVWHSKFRAYFKDIVDATQLTSQNFKPVVRQTALTTLWIQSLPGMSQVGGFAGASSLGSYTATTISETSGHTLEPKTTVSLAVEELVEIHRLLLTYQWKIAPNASDPLHTELQKLPPVPEICSQDGGTGDQLAPLPISSNNLVDNHEKQEVEVTKRSTPERSIAISSSLLLTPPRTVETPRIEDCSLYSKDDEDVDDEDGGGGDDEDDDSGGGGGEGGDDDDDDDIQPFGQFAKWPRRFRSREGPPSEEGSFVLPADQHLVLTMEASELNQLSAACLYAAGAASIRCTDCFAFAHRPCHPCSRRQADDIARVQRLLHSCQTAPHGFFRILAGSGGGGGGGSKIAGWGSGPKPEGELERVECSNDDDSNCVFCVFERVSLPWSQPAAFVFGWASSQPPVPVIVTSDSPAPYVAFAIGKKQKPTLSAGGSSQAISQDFGKDWITAKEQLSFLLRWAALQKCPSKERPPWHLKGSSSVHISEWLCLLRSWVVRQQLELNSRKKYQPGNVVGTTGGDLWNNRVAPNIKTSLMNLHELDFVSEERESMLNSLQRRLDVLQSSMDRIHETRCGQPMSVWHVSCQEYCLPLKN
ncbi:unnamed protein product [Schistocephalus solidus]|uniref:Ras-GAP domain-containing protein n=1 Tax=Schistocephalus solidus TaxID=70667 RepID=A0A183T1W7_SCHSO|nr:unnamed protein product [Schistocephalus solidus]